MSQPSLFDTPASSCCPTCRSNDIVAIDLDMVGECIACGSTLWRDDERSAWEPTAEYFGYQLKPAKRARQTRGPQTGTVAANYFPSGKRAA